MTDSKLDRIRALREARFEPSKEGRPTTALKETFTAPRRPVEKVKAGAARKGCPCPCCTARRLKNREAVKNFRSKKI
jgi:hypothetical protein